MSTVDHPEIYRTQANYYDQLVRREDYQHNLEETLRDILPRDNLTVVELGAGTGRITCLLAPRMKSVLAFDRSRHMLLTARENLRAFANLKWNLAVCDHQDLPVKDGLADLAISGWSVCYALVGEPEVWKGTLDRVLSEMVRVLQPAGVLAIIETLGTGFENPTPPEGLVSYYQILEAKGFQHTWIRTDYQFKDMDEAEMLTRFFFGEEMVTKISEIGDKILLPECTGIWWLRKGSN